MSEGDFDHLIKEVSDEWNKAEKAIKHAENVDGEVVNPAIFELRYSGRRLVEALAKRETDAELAVALLRDAKFDCHRARHDAIDAATSKMAGDLNAAVEYLPAKVVMGNFPDFSEFYAHLLEVRGKISESRENRDDRDKIYDSIQATDLDRLVTLYNRFRACEPLMIKTAEQEQRTERRNKLFGYGGLAVGIIGVIIALVTYLTKS